MNMKKQAIGVFDSGIGGLTILKALHQTLPHEDLIYFGDTAHVPYGNKSKQAVTQLALKVGKFLESRHVKLVVVACNTASAQALVALRKELHVPVMGVIEPGALCAAAATKNHRIAVLGTAGTVRSRAYVKALAKQAPQANVLQQACPLFVPLAEEGFAQTPAAKLIAQTYLAPVQKHRADTVILGCTHYPILRPLIADILGPSVHLVDSADVLAQAVAKFLLRKHLAQTSGRGTVRLYASDDPAKFTASATLLLGTKVGRAVLKKL